MSNRFDHLENQASILQEVAAAFPHESPQYVAIMNATYALIFAMSEQYESFIRYVESSKEELTDEQKEHLQKLGILED